MLLPEEHELGEGAWACKLCYNKWKRGQRKQGKKRRTLKATVRGEKGDGVDIEGEPEAEEEDVDDLTRMDEEGKETVKDTARVPDGLIPPPAPTPPPESQPPPVPPRGRLQPSPFWNWVRLHATAFNEEPVVGEAEVAPPQPNPQETYRLRRYLDDIPYGRSGLERNSG